MKNNPAEQVDFMLNQIIDHSKGVYISSIEVDRLLIKIEIIKNILEQCINQPKNKC